MVFKELCQYFCYRFNKFSLMVEGLHLCRFVLPSAIIMTKLLPRASYFDFSFYFTRGFFFFVFLLEIPKAEVKGSSNLIVPEFHKPCDGNGDKAIREGPWLHLHSH